MVQYSLKALGNRGGVITAATANATAKALTIRNRGLFRNIDTHSPRWRASLFRRM